MFKVLKFLLVFLNLKCLLCEPFDKVLTSGYSDVILTYSLKNGFLERSAEIKLEPNMSFIQVLNDKSEFFAVHEVSSYDPFGKSGAISRWKIGQDPGGNTTFTKLQVVPSNGTGPCFVRANLESGFLHAANYDGSSYTSYKIDKSTGEILKWNFTANFGPGSNVHPDRQAAAHPHGTFVFGQFVYVTDLGSDKIWHYKASDSGIVPGSPPYTSLLPGSGPRHMAIDASGKVAYVIHELKSVILILNIDPVSGDLFLKGAVDVLEHTEVPLVQHTWPFQYAAEIEIHPSGKFLFASNRGSGELVIYQIQDDHNLKFVQDKNILEVFEIDEQSGRISKIQQIASNNSPTVVAFYS